MYKIDVENFEEILCYHDLYTGEPPNLYEEIQKLNMHKAISIISELINTCDYVLEMEDGVTLPFELVIKKIMLGVSANSAKEFFSNPLLREEKHVITLQMLLILLKKIIAHGNYNSLSDINYTIDTADYSHIIMLQLVVAEEFDKLFDENKVDINHFVYANYHINNDWDVANNFARSYYMLQQLSTSKNNFDSEIQKQYRDYFGDFTAKYQYTPTQYLAFLFWELTVYYPPKNALANRGLWRNVNNIYSKTEMYNTAIRLVDDLSKKTQYFKNWAKSTEMQMWDFSQFDRFPFLRDENGDYISISLKTLKNTFFQKLFWHIRECYPKEEDESMAFYGRLFERYLQQLTEHAISISPNLRYIPEFQYDKDSKFSSDAYIQKDEKLIVIESKGYSILRDSLAKNKDIDKNNRKLFIDPVLQADERFHELDQIKGIFDDISEVFIISVTMDCISAVPVYVESIINEISNRKLSYKTKYFFNLSIEEYEKLMFLAENDNDIFAILKSYFESEKLLPFITFLQECFSYKTMRTKWISEIYRDATTKIHSMY